MYPDSGVPSPILNWRKSDVVDADTIDTCLFTNCVCVNTNGVVSVVPTTVHVFGKSPQYWFKFCVGNTNPVKSCVS